MMIFRKIKKQTTITITTTINKTIKIRTKNSKIEIESNPFK
jgi:hypothetical protein